MADDEARISLLVKRRGQKKAALTRFKNYVESEGVDLSNLKARLKKLESTFDEFEAVQTELEELEDDPEDLERETFENSYFDLVARASNLLAAFPKPTIPAPTPAQVPAQVPVPTIYVHEPIPTPSIAPASQVRLPKINLPVFSGAYDEWCPFQDMFLSLIDSNDKISNIEKLQYLKASLKGDALSLLNSIEINSGNYKIAWELLKSRYNNERLIIQRHVRALLDTSPVVKESLSALRAISNNLQKHLQALKALKCPVDQWDDLLIPIITSKLDQASVKDWEKSIDQQSSPKMSDFLDFFSRKCATLEIIETNASCQNSHKNSDRPHRKGLTHVALQQPRKCEICGRDHLIYLCQTFAQMSIPDRIKKIKELKLCINCFKSNHSSFYCMGKRCRVCNKKHHTLLHLPFADLSPNPTQIQEPETPVSLSNALHCLSEERHVLLATATVLISDERGNFRKARALLDNGSQTNFVTQNLISKLRLEPKSTAIQIRGVNPQGFTTINKAVTIKCQSTHSNFQFDLDCLVLTKITEQIPFNLVALPNIYIPKNIKLSDPEFAVPNDIDLLIGSETFWKLLCTGVIKTPGSSISFHKTLLGWIVTGSVPAQSNMRICNLSISTSLDSTLERFWKLEDVGDTDNKRHYSKEEKMCEEHFIQNTVRNSEGRFIVRLPFKLDPSALGDSRQYALKRFYSLEKRLNHDPNLRKQYSEFIREYVTLGHMVHVTLPDDSRAHYYLPHHPVIKESSLTTKLRVVFDASAVTSTGVSLNNALLVGPTIQNDLFSILLRFRIHKYVLTADVAKMYRQVLIDPSQTSFQRILWRDNPANDVSCFELKTVTYGTAPASFLAIRCLHQIAKDCEVDSPLASKVIHRDFYVDDLLTGANTLPELLKIRDEVTRVLEAGKFPLRKWASNNTAALHHAPQTEEIMNLNLDEHESIKTLGLQWNPSKDQLLFTINVPLSPHEARLTKRIILSKISQIFDPLGLITPVTITAKILMQRLWTLKVHWDESLPLETRSEWSEYHNALLHLNTLIIPRCTMPIGHEQVELHGFCDASELAYGACVYIRTTCNQSSTAHLLCSKSRVAPLKAISMPRLELCGAVLLTKLLNRVKNDLQLAVNRCVYWTDSTIVLSWIHHPSRSFNTFVSNRVSEIQQSSEVADWRHVSTSENPADLISRGIASQSLQSNSLWWFGPSFLSDSSIPWPTLPLQCADVSSLPDVRKLVHLITAPNNPDKDFDIFSRFSSFTKLIRVTAYCRRFYFNSKSPQTKAQGFLKASELSSATNCLVRLIQKAEFNDAMTSLRNGNPASPSGKLLTLNPFIDDEGILRVGGRLRNVNLSYEIKHPILLPAKHPFTKLLIIYTHKVNLHAGNLATLSIIRQRFWPLSGRNSVRTVLRQCVTCFRVNPKSPQPIMGDLPTSRVTPQRPFAVTGVDFCGPFQIKEGNRRGVFRKAYVAVFVCFLTKAVHLELVSNLSTEAFIASLRRFTSRRGAVTDIYSDNATNFVGAKNQLYELYKTLTSRSSIDQIIHALPDQNFSWHFIPASSPTFGGLWEAAVKSAKSHIKRVAGLASLNFEELVTLLAQIEAVMNSRPILPLSNDPNDPVALTPGHFLIGDALTSIPEKNWEAINFNRLSSWERIQKMKQHFWSRWAKEYLITLQQRTKWKKNSGPAVSVGDVVILKDDTISSLQWRLARVQSVHPGHDGIIRAVSVITPSGSTMKRAVNRLCVLPTGEELML